MNSRENRVSCSHFVDSNTSCVPAFTSRYNQVINNEVEKSSSGTDGGNSQGKKEKIFPWLTSFSKQCCAAVGNKSVKQLENLLTTYIQFDTPCARRHVTPHYNECQKLPNKAFKVKRNINETMVFLHLLYSDLHEPLENGFYHEKMAEVMAMYLDLEITASRRGKDTVKEVYNRLSSTLYTLLDHSDDHILDALLRTQLVNKHSKHLCGPFLRKVLTELVVRRPLSALTYVRYVLAFKLWKNVVAEANEKKAINKIALQRLHPPPKFFQDHDIAKPSAEILPKVPKNKKNSSQFYLQTKFNLKDACRAFFRFCKETNCQEEPVYLPTFSEKTEDVESNGCLSLINDIWSTISKDASDNMPLLGKSEVFSEDRMFGDDSSLCESEEVFIKAEVLVESPDSGVCLDEKAKMKRKRSTDGERDKVPDSTYVVYPDSQEVKSGCDESTDVDGSVTESISEAASPEPSSTVSVPAVDENQRCSQSSSFNLHLPNEATGKFVEAAVEPATSVSVVSHCSLPTPPVSSEGDEVDVKIKGECPDEIEVPSSSLYQQCLAPYPIAGEVAVEEKMDTLTYEMAREDLAELEWRRYSAALQNYKTSVDVSTEEQVMDDALDGGRNHHSSANCHLPLKKRKLAARSPTTEPKQGCVPDLVERRVVEERTRREEKRDFVAQWDLQESRFQPVEYVPTDTRWCLNPAVQPEENTPADLSTTASERVAYLQRRTNMEEFYCAPESLSSSPGAPKLDGVGQSSPQVSSEVPDNLKILAEEAARIWEEREQGTSVQVPYGVYPLQTGALDIKASFLPTYSGGRMMSLAEALERQSHKMEESVIVRNDQYQYFKEQSNGGRVYSTLTSQYHASSSRHEIPVMKDTRYHRVNGDTWREGNVANKTSVLHNGIDYREHKPIDMSGKSKDSILPYSQNVCDKSRAVLAGESSSCSKCKSLGCDGKCGVGSIDKGVLNRTPGKVSCCNCKSQFCNGKKCMVASRSTPHVGASRPNSTGEVHIKYKMCSYCKNASCGGTCRSESNGNAYRPSKSVCQYCKNSGCDSRCWYTSPESSKKRSSCQSPSSKGRCKANQNSTNRKGQAHEMQSYSSTAKFAKCHYCKSTCFGTCRLAEKNQSLENAKCNSCNTVNCKGKCSTGVVCSYCSQKSCSGACRIHHSVDSILGSSSSSSVLNETSSRSNRRRTRNSVQVQQSKGRTTVQEEKAATESKRRKKSVSR